MVRHIRKEALISVPLPHISDYAEIYFDHEDGIREAKEKILSRHIALIDRCFAADHSTLDQYNKLRSELSRVIFLPGSTREWEDIAPLAKIGEKVRQCHLLGDRKYYIIPDVHTKEDIYEILRGSFYTHMEYLQEVIRKNFSFLLPLDD